VPPGCRWPGALVVTEDDDVGNLHAALAAQELHPALRLRLRVFNRELGRRVQELFPDCQVFDSAGLAVPAFVAAALLQNWQQRVEVDGRTLVVRQAAVTEPDVLLSLARVHPDGTADLFPDTDEQVLCLAEAPPTRRARRPERLAADQRPAGPRPGRHHPPAACTTTWSCAGWATSATGWSSSSTTWACRWSRPSCTRATRYLPAVRRLGVPVLVGDIRLPETLEVLHVRRARSVVAAPAFTAAMAGEHVLATVAAGEQVLAVTRLRVAPGCQAEGRTVGELELAAGSRVLLLSNAQGSRWRPEPATLLGGGTELVGVVPSGELGRVLAWTGTGAHAGRQQRP
jgi:hypothetical protein